MSHRTCKTCGITVPAVGSRQFARCRPCAGVSCGTLKSYVRGCRCSECRAANAAAMLAYTRARVADGKPRRESRAAPRETCIDCGQSESTERGPRCLECRVERRNRRKRLPARRAQAAARQAEAAKGARGWGVWTQGRCAECSEGFLRKSQGSPFCSPSCRRRGRKKWITETRRRAIYERDNWTCQLCMEPVDRDAHHLDDWYPSLDHIIPRSHTLIPDHSDENLRTCHRWCNAVRGDESHYTAADLLAA